MSSLSHGDFADRSGAGATAAAQFGPEMAGLLSGRSIPADAEIAPQDGAPREGYLRRLLRGSRRKVAAAVRIASSLAPASASGSSVGSSTASARVSPAAKHRRPIGDWFIHAPHLLRALVRADEVWLVLLAAFVGAIAGLCV